MEECARTIKKGGIMSLQIGRGKSLRGTEGHLLCCATALLLAAAGCAPESKHEEAVAKIQARLGTSGTARVTVLLNETASRRAVEAAQDAVGNALVGLGSRVVHKFKSGPGMSVEVTSESDLDALANHPSVDRFDLTMEVKGGMNDSRALVGADEAFNAGFTGDGRVIAVLDSGYEATHDDLEDDLVDEACFLNLTPACPNGMTTQFGPGAAADDLGHGSHVSGIITSAGTGPAPRGIAPDAGIVAVKVLNANDDGTFDDIVAGLEWVNDNHPEVDAVNMSIQGGLFNADCDLEPFPSPDIVNLANAVGALRDNSILTVACSGNSFAKDSLAAPSCLSEVVAVGASDKNNVVTEFSNSNEGLEILAPGDGFTPFSGITSVGLGNTAVNIPGTSMASPQVAAAISLLYESNSELQVEEVLECLFTSDTQLTDAGNGLTRPLLDIPAALDACDGEDECTPQTYEAETMFHSTGGAVPGGWNIWTNGYISTNHVFTAGPTSLTVRARGQSAAGVAAHMVVSVNGAPIANTFVANTAFADFNFNFVATAGTQEIRVAFDNDLYNPPQDRNLYVDSVRVNCEPAANPCQAFCASPTPISWSGSYQSGSLGTGAVCRETTQPVAGGNCGNFSGGRQLLVNGVAMPCNNVNWPSLPAPVNGGYCIQATAGQPAWSFFTLF
jgi:subtilisin family serine protease